MTALMIEETGEIVEQMTAEEASSITTQISVKLDAIADNYQSVMPLIRDAITRQAHAALGYRSPGDYLRDRFSNALGRLGVDMRQQVVRELADAGMSTRAIAPVVGVSHVTVASDKEAPVKNLTGVPAPAEASKDSVSPGISPSEKLPKEASDDEPLTQAECEALDQSPALTTTGVDGKTYPRPTAESKKKHRRGDLTADARRLSQDLRRLTARIQKLAADDRLRRNAEQVTSTTGRHLSDCIDACQDYSMRCPQKENSNDSSKAGT